MKFEPIYREHFEFVWRTLQRMGVRDRDIQDVSQKVFLVAFQRLPEFEGRSALKTWLCGIALRVASDYRRSAVQRREWLTQDESVATATIPTQHDELERAERLRELDAVLDKLPIEQRTVLVLFELEEMPGPDIAQTLGIPEGTVRSRLRLARENFTRIAAERRQTPSPLAAGGAR